MKKLKNKIIHWLGGIVPEEVVPAKASFEIIKTEMPIVTLQVKRMYDEDFYTLPILKEEIARQLADDIVNYDLCKWDESVDYDTDFKIIRATVRIAAPKREHNNGNMD